MDIPLVSVVVASYNSGQFIIDTLESVKAQTYKNIELIVSDDFSTDDTIDISRAWLAANKDRFARTDLITVTKNTGVSANCNRSIHAARSEWIKFIAGDDILLPNCIEDNMNFVADHPETKILFSKVKVFVDDFKEGNYLKTMPGSYPMNIMDPAFTAAEQFKILLLGDRISFTPSYFFNKQALLSVGGYDEQNKLIEDYPMWLKLTGAGFKLYFMDVITVGYRQHAKALNNVGDDSLFKPLFLKMYLFRKANVYPYLPWDIVGAEKHVVFVSKIFQRLGLNKGRSLNRKLYRLLTVYFNPFQYVYSFKKHVLKKGMRDVLYN